MGLITKEVEVGLGGINLRHFENLGYQIPRTKKYGRWCVPRGTTILARVEDLPNGSNIYVDLECDRCGKLTNDTYKNYSIHNHDGLTYCKACANFIFNSGENNAHWNPKLTDKERKNGRCYPEYVEFVKRVMARDNYTCQCCGQKHGDIEVHHMDGYDWCIEKRTDDTNGITLCHSCHYSFHKMYGFGENKKEQFEKWLGKAFYDLEKYNGKLPTTRKIYCIEENKIYNSSAQLVKEWKIASKSQVHDVCNHKKHCHTILGKHVLWLDEYEKMTTENIQNFLKKHKYNNQKTIICLTTGKIFDNHIIAKEYYNLSKKCDIKGCCRGRAKSAGKLSDGTPLRWMYYEDYLNLSNEEKQELENKYKIQNIESEVA